MSQSFSLMIRPRYGACILVRAVLAWALQEQTMKSDCWPHRRCALRGPFFVTKVRWFMIYFPITPSLLCALGLPVNKCWAWLSHYIFPPTSAVEDSLVLASSVKPNWDGLPQLLLHLVCTRARMSGNWNKGRDSGEIKKPWMTELQWCWIQLEADSLGTPGPPGRWWGLRVT